jgi:hypothetical protein
METPAKARATQNSAKYSANLVMRRERWDMRNVDGRLVDMPTATSFSACWLETAWPHQQQEHNRYQSNHTFLFST